VLSSFCKPKLQRELSTIILSHIWFRPLHVQRQYIVLIEYTSNSLYGNVVYFFFKEILFMILTKEYSSKLDKNNMIRAPSQHLTLWVKWVLFTSAWARAARLPTECGTKIEGLEFNYQRQHRVHGRDPIQGQIRNAVPACEAICYFSGSAARLLVSCYFCYELWPCIWMTHPNLCVLNDEFLNLASKSIPFVRLL